MVCQYVHCSKNVCPPQLNFSWVFFQGEHVSQCQWQIYLWILQMYWYCPVLFEMQHIFKRCPGISGCSRIELSKCCCGGITPSADKADVGCLSGLCMSCYIYARTCTKPGSAACTYADLNESVFISWFVWCPWTRRLVYFTCWFTLAGPSPARCDLRFDLMIIWNSVDDIPGSCRWVLTSITELPYNVSQKLSASIFLYLIECNNCFLSIYSFSKSVFLLSAVSCNETNTFSSYIIPIFNAIYSLVWFCV